MATTVDDIAQFVLDPFREIVDKGKAALQNAGDSQVMAKASQSLVKEGERALKKIEPLCKRYVVDYGVNFRNALRDHDDIGDYRTKLEDLLWEFDDYTSDPDSFEADKFAELQALSRRTAPRIYDILMRMKLETPYDDLSPVGSIPHSLAHQASPSSRNSNAFFSSADSAYSPRDGRASPGEPRPDSGIYTVEDATNQLKTLMGEEDGFNENAALEEERSHRAERQPPQMPKADPWDVNAPPPTEEAKSSSDAAVRRRPEVPRGRSESPIDPTISPVPEPQSRLSQGSTHQETLSHSTNGVDSERPNNDDRSSLPSSNFGPSSPRSAMYFNYQASPARPQNVSHVSHLTSTIPEDAPVDGTGGFSIMQPQTSARSPFGPPTASSYTSTSTYPGFETTRRPTIHSHGTQQSIADTVASSQISPGMNPRPDPYEGIQVAPPNFREPEPPIPVLEEDQSSERNGSTHQPSLIDCSITPRSSFWMAKGFCEGAKEVSRGGIGVKKTKKPVGFTTSATVARCTSCMCELGFKDIENDVNKLDSGNYSRGGINYRVRFLQKSHLNAKRNDDVQYGCLFCLQLGHTMDESDATVFFSPKALMDHLGRHPRPLPDVPGLTVIEGKDIPPEFHNDYDIQFTRPPEPHPVIEARSEIIDLPTATTKEPARRLYGQRLLFDRTPALELAAGARITGITWPSKYIGEWAMGWHDGVYASVPTDLLKLDRPPNNQIKIGGSGNIRGRAKWKFNPGKDKSSDWLKIDRSDVITDIGWSHFDHWCWSGTNSKGKWGIFPQAFIDKESLEEPTGLNRAMSLNEEMGRSSSFIPKFGGRKSAAQQQKYSQNSMRPVSVAGSTSSHESRGVQMGGRTFAADVHAS